MGITPATTSIIKTMPQPTVSLIPPCLLVEKNISPGFSLPSTVHYTFFLGKKIFFNVINSLEDSYVLYLMCYLQPA